MCSIGVQFLTTLIKIGCNKLHTAKTIQARDIVDALLKESGMIVRN